MVEGDKYFNNMLITGSNGSGKSTYIKSIIECIILGQTIGIVPAEGFSFTPFVNITTYFFSAPYKINLYFIEWGDKRTVLAVITDVLLILGIIGLNLAQKLRSLYLR